MWKPKMRTRLSIVCAALALSGCATFSSVNGARSTGEVLYSGVRLDLAAINHDSDHLYALSLRGVYPPAYPEVDLPFSLVGDTAMLAGLIFTCFGHCSY